MDNAAVLSVRNLSVRYALPRRHLLEGRRYFEAVTDLSFDLPAGRSLGLVGESGSGKSTTARAVMAIEKPSAGSIHICGQDVTRLSARQLRDWRSRFQMVFQDPFASLDPRYTVERIVTEPIRGMSRAERRRQAAQTLDAVGLPESALDKYPHQFSGGQRQRIAIARALITKPALIVADEAVSALDVSVQAQVLNLMKDLQASSGVSYLFIGHDLGVVQYLCDEIIVMHRGRAVERGNARDIVNNPSEQYTKELITAMPRLGRRRRISIHDREDARPGHP